MKKYFFTLLFTLVFGLVYSQNVIYVDSSVTSSGNGNSWSTAIKTITEAIDSSSSGDTIKIAKGTYFEDTTLIIPHALMLRGGYPTGGGITQDTSSNRTIIDGDSSFTVISKNGDYNLSINHLVIQNGYGINGGGISIISNAGDTASSVLLIENSIIRYNKVYASNYEASGGGIFFYSSSHYYNSSVNLVNTSVYNNTASASNYIASGGGIYANSYNPFSDSSISSVNLTNCNIYNNKAASDTYAYGGGIYMFSSYSSLVSITNSNVHNNTASSDSSYVTVATGGGIYSFSDSYSSTVNLTNSSMYNNMAVATANAHSSATATASGGGVYSFTTSSYSSVNLTNSNVYNNIVSASDGPHSTSASGGGIYSDSYFYSYSIVSITNSNLYNNKTSSDGSASGGAIYSIGNSYSFVSLINSSVYKNTAFGKTSASGGGIHSYSYTDFSSVKITSNSSLYSNTASSTSGTSSGGGICASSLTSNSVYLANSSLNDNIAISISTSGNSYGGGIYSSSPSSSVKITNNCNLNNNIASSANYANGGGIYSSSSSSSSIILASSSLHDNTASCTSSARGGGIYSYSSSSLVRITNSNLYNNNATSHFFSAYGGGISAFSSSSSSSSSIIRITNSSIYNNSVFAKASSYGGGVYAYSFSSSPSSLLKIINSIFAKNVGGASPHYENNGQNNINYSYIGGEDLSGIGVGNFDGKTVNPLFVDTVLGDYHLQNGSPLINAGNNDSIPNDIFDIDNDSDTTELLPIDLEGIVRVMGDTVDLGPYETLGYSRAVLNSVVCDSLVSPSGKYIWTTSGKYYDTLMNSYGYDSLITIYLIVNYSNYINLTISVCDSMVSPSGKYTWKISSTYYDTIPTTSGCDSFITLNLTVNHPTISSLTISVCDSMISPSGKCIWKTSGAYYDTIPNINGCDSLMSIFLTVKNSTKSIISIVACDSIISPSGKYIWTKSGIYQDTISNTVGCDSVMSINLTVNKLTNSIFTNTVCDSMISPSNKYIWKTSGTYYDTIPNFNGCDSLMTIFLTVNNSTKSTLSITVCDSTFSPSRKYIWSISGIYQDTISNAVSCDSVMTINLTVYKSSSSILTDTTCESMLSPSGKYTWTNSGTYYDTIKNTIGCDSFITINLMVNYSSSSTLNNTVCDSLLSPSGNYIWKSSGTYYDTIQNTNGCDSFIKVNLTVNSTSSIITNTVCDSLLSPSGKYTWTTSGTFYDTIPNTNGCDSLMTINLIVNNSTSATFNFSVCKNLISPSGKYSWIKSGIYQDTIKNSNGCDSIIIVNLTIDSVDLSISNNSNTLTANQSGASSYQWLDCSNDSIILGETNQNFTPITNGSYAVIMNYNSCYDTSACLNINNVGIDKNELDTDIKIYPNPTKGIFIIDFGNSNSRFNISIVDVLGKNIMEFISNQNQEKIDLSEYASGVYFINIANQTGNKTVKIIKE